MQSVYNMTSPFFFGTILEIDGDMSRRDGTGGDTWLEGAGSVWIFAWTVRGECSKGSIGWLGWGAMVALMFVGSLGVVDPPWSMGARFGLWSVLPLVPGFPLVGGRLFIWWVLSLVVLIVSRWVLREVLRFPWCRMKWGWFSTGYVMVEVIIVILPYFTSTWRCWSQMDRRSSTGTSGWVPWRGVSSAVWSWSRWTICSSQRCGPTRASWNRDWTFVWCPMVTMGARPRATLRMLRWWWNFTRWRRMTWNGWSNLNWWLSRSRRLLVQIALLGLVHKCLHTGLNSVLHLLYHLFCIEGCTGCRWSWLGCHRCGWIRHWSWRLGLMWMECGLMEWKKLLKVLDMCLSLDSQLLMQHVILLSESRQLCLILSLELSLWLSVHKITATKLTLKSHRLWVPEGPHIVRIPSRKHGSTVRRLKSNKISSNKMHPQFMQGSW